MNATPRPSAIEMPITAPAESGVRAGVRALSACGAA